MFNLSSTTYASENILINPNIIITAFNLTQCINVKL